MTTTRRTVAPAYLPVTLAQARLHCRIDGTEEDALLTGVIMPGAVDVAQQLTGRSIMLQTWRQTLDAFPSCGMRLPFGTVQSVTAVEYRDSEGDWQTLSASVYEVDLENLPARITLQDGQSWPSVWTGTNVVRVTYTAGYSASATEATQQAAVPASVKQWLLLTIGTAFAQRESIAQGISVAELPGRFVDGLLDSEKAWGL